MVYAPLALFVYNRPEHTRRTIEALTANTLAAQTPLHVFSDAPRNETARHLVEEVRSYIRTITGFKSVSIVERATNFGLAHSIIDGVTSLCDAFGHVIVLEDDLVTSPYFLSYMNDALTRYEYEERVMQIAGYMFPVKVEIQDDALLLPFTSSWGWATWERAWRHFDTISAGYERLVKDHSLRQTFDLNGRYEYFKMLDSQMRGKTDSWAIRWYLTVFLMKGLALYPRKSLVENCGFDGSGVNCVASSIEVSKIDPYFRVAAMPQQISVSEKCRDILEGLPRPKLNMRTMLSKVRHLVTGFCNERIS